MKTTKKFILNNGNLGHLIVKCLMWLIGGFIWHYALDWGYFRSVALVMGIGFCFSMKKIWDIDLNQES